MIRLSPLMLALVVAALALALFSLGGEPDRSLTMAPDMHAVR
jgi:hypothetical protein